MLIKIGDCWVDPEEVVAVYPDECAMLSPGDFTNTVLVLRGNQIALTTHHAIETAIVALQRTGYIEAPEEAPTWPELTPAERLELQSLQAYGYEWIARDKSGQAYAYWSRPEKAASEWFVGEGDGDRTVRLRNSFDFLVWEDEKPTSIAWAISQPEE